ncbi:MAG: YjfI family protein [Halomonas sp.]|nr:YjfI family protein [Halomonas sp.]
MTTPDTNAGVTAAELYRIVTQSMDTTDDTAIKWPQATISLDDDHQTLVWELSDYGNLPITLSRSDNEWVAMAPIVAVETVKDTAALNETLLRQGLSLPLASVGIVCIDGRDVYVAYGQLFSDSKLESICAELHATAGAAIEVAELIQTHFV